LHPFTVPRGTTREALAEHFTGWCFAVRLSGGPRYNEGRLEVLRNGSWGTVCDDFFTNAAAQVACYMLGFG